MQVASLMWLRTTVQYQYRTGAGTRAALRALYADGGVRRFYRGVGPALLQVALQRRHQHVHAHCLRASQAWLVRSLMTAFPPRRCCTSQGPLCRFGDTAANAGVLALLAEFEATAQLPVGVKTAAASAAAGAWRMLLLPIDAAKTMMQVRPGCRAATAACVRITCQHVP